MNFRFRRLLRDARQLVTFETFMMLVMLLFLTAMNAWGCYNMWKKTERKRISCGAAAGLTPAPADAEPEAPRK